MEFTLAWQDEKLDVLSELRTALHCDLYTEFSVQGCMMMLNVQPTGISTKNEAAMAIAHVIVGSVQKRAIEKISEKALHQLTTRERNTVNMLTRLRMSQKGMSERSSGYIATVATRVKDCLNDQPLHLEGFLCFRMRDYVQRWARCMDEVINRAIQEHEYSEYINILRDILTCQLGSGECVYITGMKDGRFKVADQREICILDGNSDFAVERGLTAEDELICNLLMKAPAEIIIIDSENTLSTTAFETILRVFEGRVRLCEAMK